MERLTELLLPALALARQSAQRTTSAVNIRSILSACFVYANDNKGILPESLDVLVQGGLVRPEQLVNPTDPQHRRYVYRRWVPEWNKIDATTPLVWEETDERSEGANMGFGDGHVEYVRGRDQVQARISAAAVSKPKEPGRTDRP
jgi:prepilin-type processing-associated H-X9-DG protein